MYKKIEVDEDVFAFLQKNAEPFIDTPNSVLRRYLLKNKKYKPKKIENLIFPLDMPKKLTQTLEMIYFVRVKNVSRIEATHMIARKDGIAPQTVSDKFCRQFDLKVSDIDFLLLKSNTEKFKKIIINKCPSYSEYIKDFFEKYII